VLGEGARVSEEGSVGGESAEGVRANVAERRRPLRCAPGEVGEEEMGNSVEMMAPRSEWRERGDRGGVVGGDAMGISVLPRLNSPARAGAEPDCASTASTLLRFPELACVASLLLRPFASEVSCAGSAGSCASVTVVLPPRGPRFAGSRGCRYGFERRYARLSNFLPCRRLYTWKEDVKEINCKIKFTIKHKFIIKSKLRKGNPKNNDNEIIT
jgi:hypothetical protein